MKRSYLLSLIFAVSWLLIKILFYFLGDSELGFNIGVSTNLIFILAIVALVLWTKYRDPSTKKDLITDVKDTSKPALLYVILMIIFLTAHYSFIDTTYLTNRMNIRYNLEVDNVRDDVHYTKMVENNLLLQQDKVTKEEYLTTIKEKIEEQYNVKTIAFGGFIVFTITTFIYSFLISFLFRNFLFK